MVNNEYNKCKDAMFCVYIKKDAMFCVSIKKDAMHSVSMIIR